MLLGASLRNLPNARSMDVNIVDSNGDPITSFTSVQTPPATAALTSVATSTTSVQLLASNAARRKFLIHNDASKTLYVAFAATATSTAFSVLIPGNGSYESDVNDYTGEISGILQTGSGNARITELS